MEEYFFIEFNNKYICLICKESVATPKEYNFKHHYTCKKSYNSFDSAERKNEFKKLKASLASQQNIFHRANNISENATFATYEVAHLIAKHGKPFSDGEFVKECLIKAVGRLIPEKMDDINNVSLSRQTITRPTAELSADVKDQVTAKSKSFDLFSFACDESTNASDTAQLLIFLEVLMTISASQRSCLIFRVLQAQKRVTIFLKLRQMRLTRWDLVGISCVELQQMGLQQLQVSAKGWPPWFATKCVKAEVKLLNSTVSSTKRPSVQRKSSSEM